MNQLSADAETLLGILPATGRITNYTAVKLTGWDTERMMKAKHELRAAGLIEVRKAWGGPFGRLDQHGLPPSPGPALIAAADERELYRPVLAWVSAEFVPDDFDKDRDLFEATTSADRRPQGAGTWEVPDIVSISLKKYPFVPRVLMEVTSFEIKPQSQAFNVYGIFEAISQSKAVHHAYYCFEWTGGPFQERSDYQRIYEEADTHGIGLVRIQFADAAKSAIVTETLLESRARDPEPSALNSVIEMFFAADVKQRIARRTGFSIVW